MSDNTEETSGGVSIDLSELKNFSFHANFDAPRRDRVFSDGERPRRPGRRFGDSKGGAALGGSGKSFDGRGGSGRTNSDRTGERSPRNFSDRDGKREGRDFHGRRDFNGRVNNFQRFEPMVDIEFYPNDEVFDAVASALKATCKTYELFAAARLFLEKPERFALVIKKKDGQGDKNLYLANDDSFVFETESEAVAHVLEHHIEKYFAVEEREVPPPMGNFTCLYKCGLTGKVLCPPNYHRYQEILANHHEKFLPNVPFRKFKDSIEKITDPQEIENWKAASTKVRVFVPRTQGGSEKAAELKSDDEVRRFFCENLKEQAITSYDSVRISGVTFAKMPRSLLSKSIFVSIEREKAFPLKLSNNLRGRLRRAGFTIYKMGGKSGITYISGIRRKFRNVGDVFADDVQKIISCIDANRKISIASLRLQCLPRNVSIIGDKIAASDGEVASAEGHPANNSSADGKGEKENSEGQEFLKNLHWLIREGYVAEFEDGTLISTEIMQPQKKTGKADGTGKVTQKSTGDANQPDGKLENFPEAVTWDGEGERENADDVEI